MGKRLFFLVTMLISAIFTSAYSPTVAVAHTTQYLQSAALQTLPGSLQQMLAQVNDNELSRAMMMYGSLADLQSVLGIKLNSADDYRKLTRAQQTAYLMDVNVNGKQVYYSLFSGIDQPTDWKTTFGIDTYQIDRELVVGVSPNWYGILQGNFASADIGNNLKKLGYKTITVGGNSVFAIGGDNTPPNAQISNLVSSNYNRLSVTNTRLVAAPSTALMQTALTVNQPIINDPSYAALVQTLENSAPAAGTTLVSGALFGGPYLSDTIITADPLAAAVGDTLSANQLDTLRNKLKLQNEKLLPRYETVGFGYLRNAKTRFWVITLVYKDAAKAQSANTILASRMKRYVSFIQTDRKLFRTWQVSTKTSTAQNGLPVVTVTMQVPSQTDVTWIDLINQRDLGFLATEH